MKTTLFKRTTTLLAIGFALLTSVTVTSLNANVFAAEENLIEYVNSSTKFSFQGPDDTTYEFSLVKLVAESSLPNPSEKQIANAKTVGVQFVKSTKNNQTLDWELITNSRNGELTASEIDYNNYIELSRIITKHLVTDELQLKMYDFQYDGYIDVRDIVSLENKYYSCPTNFLILNGQKMSLDIFSSLLTEHKNNNEDMFIIYATDSPNIIETTSTEITFITNPTTILETSLTTNDLSETEMSTTSIITTAPMEETTDIITTTVTETNTIQETTITTLPEETTITTSISEDITNEPEITSANETTTSLEVTTLPETSYPEETTTENTSRPVDPDGWEIDEEIYQSLVNSAELFGVENYKIVWTQEEIPYSIIYINNWFADSFALQQQWAVQLCDIQNVKDEYPEYVEKLYLNDVYDFSYFVWRPCVKGDEQDINESFQGIRFALTYLTGTGYVPWKYQHWCLIPLDSNGNENLKFLYKGYE